MKKMIYLFVVFVLTCNFIFSCAYAKEFSDVEQTHWAYQYINELSENNVINGYQDGSFKPSGTITNAEFLKLVIACCMPKGIDLSDAEGTMDHWASNYVWIAETYGVIEKNAINENNINKPITRIEMVRLVSKADMIMKGNPSDFSKPTNFIDVATVDLQDLYMLKHAVARELIAGYEDGTFKPEKTMSRAEAATMIWRLSK